MSSFFEKRRIVAGGASFVGGYVIAVQEMRYYSRR